MPNHEIVDEYDPALGYHPSVIPLDVRLGLTTPAPSGPPLRWGVLGCSKVAHDFVQALKYLSIACGLPHSVVAVGSRSADRAARFAALHDVPNSHGSYEELCADANVDVVYVATLHPYHREHAELALGNGKHALVEKPFAMTEEDARAVYDLANRKGLFCGEGMWTRFFPAVEWARRRLGEGDDDDTDGGDDVNPIGRVRVVQADFSIDGDDVGPYPSDTIYHAASGGGSARCVLPYIVAAATMPYEKGPDRIAANGILPDDGDGAGDLAMGMTMIFSHEEAANRSNGSPPGDRSIASGVCGYLAESSETTTYAAKRGRITIDAPAHCPISATIVRKNLGKRGNGATSDTPIGDAAIGGNATTVTFRLPEPTPEIESSEGIKLPNSMEFVYEAEATRRLIASGQRTFFQWTPEESIECVRIVEEMLRQVRG
ncbi:hypothetical protein ACHAWF_001071 [Thalassiosira exigua]